MQDVKDTTGTQSSQSPADGQKQQATDARGVAEPANVATAAAVANAFYNATGKRIRTLPMTPANVLAALRA